MNLAEWSMISSANEPKLGPIGSEKRAFNYTACHWVVGISFPYLVCVGVRLRWFFWIFGDSVTVCRK